MDHLNDLNLPVIDILTHHDGARQTAVIKLLDWARNYVPDQQLGHPLSATLRQLQPIEHWIPPHSNL